MAALDLFDLQLGDFLGAGPDDGSALGVSLRGRLKCPLLRAAQHFAQHVDDEFEGVKIVVFQDDVIGGQEPGMRFFALSRLGSNATIGQARFIGHGYGSLRDGSKALGILHGDST